MPPSCHVMVFSPYSSTLRAAGDSNEPNLPPSCNGFVTILVCSARGRRQQRAQLADGLHRRRASGGRRRGLEVRMRIATETRDKCAHPYIYIYTGSRGAGENDDRGARKMRSAILDGSGVEAPLVLGWVRVIRISCYGDAASVGGLFGSSRRGRKACVCVCVCE